MFFMGEKLVIQDELVLEFRSIDLGLFPKET